MLNTFMCPIEGCGKMFRMRCHLARHQKKHRHKRKRDKIVECPHCNWKGRMSNKSRHIRRNHKKWKVNVIL